MAAYKAMGDEKEEGCMGAVCSGLGTAWYYGFSYGVLSTLIVMMLVWALGGFGGEKGHAMVATDDLGEGVVRGGYRWPTKPMVEPVSRTEVRECELMCIFCRRLHHAAAFFAQSERSSC
eukprot:1366253-Amorphochlora_amoeboformis.AAC.1